MHYRRVEITAGKEHVIPCARSKKKMSQRGIFFLERDCRVLYIDLALAKHQCFNSEIQKHHDAKDNAVISKNLEVVLLYIVH